MPSQPVWSPQGKKDRQTDRELERERERECVCVCACVVSMSLYVYFEKCVLLHLF